MYGKLKKLVQRLTGKLHPSNSVNTIFYLVFQRFDPQIEKNSILEEVICYLIPIQTLSFLAALPPRQDGVENHEKTYYNCILQKDFGL